MDDLTNPKSVEGSTEPVERLSSRSAAREPMVEERQPAALIPTPAPRGLTTDLDGEEFNKFYLDLVKERRTNSVFGEALMSDFARCHWRLAQLEHWEEQIIRSLAPRKLATLLEDFVEDQAERAELVRGWSLAEPRAVARVRKLFTAAGLATTVIDARTYFDRLDEFIKLGRMIAQARKAKTEACGS